MSDCTTSPSSVPTWQKEFDERVAAFATAIKVDEDKVREVLAKLGADGSDENSLVILDNDEFLPVVDLFQSFCDSGLTQKSRVRLGLPHLRGKTWKGDTADAVDNTTNDKLANALDRMASANRSKNDWSNEELLDKYDEDDTEVAEILRKRTHGRPCIVFNKDGTVNKPISLELIKTAKRQTTSDKYLRSGLAYRAHRAGDFPVKPVAESPFARGVALVNDYCPESDTDWSDVQTDARILAHLYVFEIETAEMSKRELKSVCDDARNGSDHFRKTYPQAALRYDELADGGKLPDLKVSPELPDDSGYDYPARRRDTGFSTQCCPPDCCH